MLYALGEIILVVIGILIAIQLDEMKNEREILERQEIFITQLKQDLEESLTDLKSVYRYHEDAIISTNYIAHAYWKPELQHDSLSYYLVDVLNNREEYKPNTGTITSLVYSGNIELIRSFEVRNSMLIYMEKVDAIAQQIVDIKSNMLEPAGDASGAVFDATSYKRQIERLNNYSDTVMTPKQKALSPYRYDFEQVPFPSDLKTIFTSRIVYNTYQRISIGHRRIRVLYGQLIDETIKLQTVLEQEGY